MAVDYIGECSDVPTVSGNYSYSRMSFCLNTARNSKLMSTSIGECSRIKCPGLPYITSSEQCQGPTPPGACCQQCGMPRPLHELSHLLYY